MYQALKNWLRPYWHLTSRRNRHWHWPSETSKCRTRLAPYCVGFGVDLGFGGDPITPAAIRIDQPLPYARVGASPVQLAGDAARLHWFTDGSLDYVFSSHLLEDFADTEGVLREWLRVLKPLGRLVLFCPDEQRFRTHCARTGQPYNPHHVHADFSLHLVRDILDRLGGMRVLHQTPIVDGYSWELVAEKVPVESSR
jgi:predicted SAM-dependent methyltransferase